MDSNLCPPIKNVFLQGSKIDMQEMLLAYQELGTLYQRAS